MNQVSRQVVFVELVEIKIPQFVVADLMGKHVIDSHQDFVGHRHHCPLPSGIHAMPRTPWPIRTTPTRPRNHRLSPSRESKIAKRGSPRSGSQIGSTESAETNSLRSSTARPNQVSAR